MIRDNVREISSTLPAGITLVAAVKGRSLAEITEAIGAGVTVLGENYVQEASRVYPAIGGAVKWHFIGHLQRNKVKKAVAIFDMIQTIDSFDIAREIDIRSGEAGKTMPVLIEVNSGRERQKSGVWPDNLMPILEGISAFSHLRVMGLMTMGPDSEDPEDSRAYFHETNQLFNQIRTFSLPGIDMKYLSMGMTGNYQVAIEEGANIIRIGSKIFSP